MFSEVVEELVALSESALLDLLHRNELERRRLDAELAAALTVADRRGLKELDGHRTMTAFCRATFNWSTTEAGRRLGLARAVDHVPDLGEAWHAGRFGLPQAVQISKAHGNPRVRERLSGFAPILIENAEQLPYSDFAVTVDHFVSQADEDGAHDDRDEIIAGRRARVVDVGGSLDVRATGGDPLTAAELIAIHQRFVDAEFAADVEQRRLEHGDLADGFALPRTDRQRRFDALVAIFRRAATAEGVGSVADPLVNIVADAATWGQILVQAGLSTATDLEGRPIDPFTGLSAEDSRDLLSTGDLTDRRCETSSGMPLHPHDVLRAALAGHVRRVVVDSQGVVIDMGRRQRLFTGSARQAAKLLVHHCEHPGCELPVEWCEVDHVTEWSDSGCTDQRNAAIDCGPHNREKHRRRWRSRRSVTGRSHTVRNDGTIMLPVGARPPVFPDEDGADDEADDSPEEIAVLASRARQRLHALRRPA